MRNIQDLLSADSPTVLRVLACASQGSGGDDEARLRMLLTNCHAEFFPFLRKEKTRSLVRCLWTVLTGDQDVFIIEGTGLGVGIPAILSALCGRRFVVSSGDAVGPFLSARFPLGSPVFHLYERLLYTACSGFIGWTPYLVGRALTMGAKHAITCPGWAPYGVEEEQLVSARAKIRAELGIPDNAVVFGIAGALTWSSRYKYCYGLELVRALARAKSKAVVLIVGDGDGAAHLQKEAGALLGSRVLLTGRIARNRMPGYLAAMDIGSLPQSVDQVGGFRYTTKISEYRSVNLPFVTNLNPVSYDLDRGDILRLPGTSPWDEEFLHSLSSLMSSITMEDCAGRSFVGVNDAAFDRDEQIRHVTAFLQDIAGSRPAHAVRVRAAA